MHEPARGDDPNANQQWERRAFEKQLLNILPEMRAFARFLTRDPTEADDIVQEAIVRALRAYSTFDLDTNIKAWMFCIIRNTRLNALRKPRADHLDDVTVSRLSTPPAQEDNLQLKEVLSALDKLSPDHRAVITLVRAGGVSYEDAALIMNCRVGTIKSRVFRADEALRAVLGKDFRAPRKISSISIDEEAFI